LEEEKASLKDYVLKYEAELSKHEAQVAQLTADLQQARPPNITTSQTRHNWRLF
jgi:peptidoglycan hydrolase CwlO-like protein